MQTHSPCTVKSLGPERCDASVMKRYTAGLVFIAIVWSLAVACSEPLHARVHPNSAQAQHQCAATLLHSGGYEAAQAAPAAPAFALIAVSHVIEDYDAPAPGAVFLSGEDRGPPADQRSQRLFA